MGNRFTLAVFFLFLLAGFSGKIQAQSIQGVNVKIIDDLRKPYKLPAIKKSYGKTNACPVDTLMYPYYKATSLQYVNMNNSNSAYVFGQWFDAQQPITISGFDFYGYQSSANPQLIVNITCKLFLANPTDSLPTGLPLATTTVPIDGNNGGNLLSGLRKFAVFSSPVTVSGPYIITIENATSNPVRIVGSDFAASPPNGRSEWLALFRFPNSNNFAHGYNVTLTTASGSFAYNADFLLHPWVSYSLTADFVPSTKCVQGMAVPITFTNTSSWVLSNKFYNTRAFFGISYISSTWDFGDTSGNWYAVSPSHNYFHRMPYTVKLKDTLYGFMNGCADYASVALDAAPPFATASSNSPVCAGSTIRLFSDTVAGASGYYWTGPNGFTSSQQHPTIANASTFHQGIYSLRAIVGQCTSMVTNTSIAIQSTPQAFSNGPLCVGQPLSLGASAIPNATYSWAGPNGFTSSLMSPVRNNVTFLDSGVYSVVITSPGCGTIGPFTTAVAVNAVPATPTAGNNGPICVGDNLNLTATGGNGNYKWVGPNGFNSQVQNFSRPTAQASYAGTYSVVLVAGGCASNPASTTVVINNQPATPVAANNGPLCAGQSLSLSATLVANATYTWSGPNSFSSAAQNPVRSNIGVLDAGLYSVIATVNGCNSVAGFTTVAVTSTTPTPSVSYNGPLCPGQTLQLNASNIPGATYSWTGPNNFTASLQNPSITNIGLSHGGTYVVTATSTGCGTSPGGSVSVVINALPAAPNVSNTGPYCDGDSIQLSASAVSDGTYNWTGPNGFTSTLQNPVIYNSNAAKAGSYSVYVDVAGCGSSSSASTDVFVRRIPNIPGAFSNSPVCEGDSLKLFGNAVGTGPNRTFHWSGPNNYNSTLKDNSIASPLVGDAGIYYLTVTDSGCTSLSGSVSTSVKARPAPPLATNNSPVCRGAEVYLNATNITGALYKWTGPGGFVSAQQNPVILGNQAVGSGMFYVTVNVNGCNSVPAGTQVQYYELPATPIASNDGPHCTGDTIHLICDPLPNVIYSWTGPAGFTSSLQNPSIINAKVGMSGTYSIHVIDSHCVSEEGKTSVVVNTIPATPTTSTLPAGPNFCLGDSVQLLATFMAGGAYEWKGPNGYGSLLQNPVIRNMTDSNTGTYTVFVTKNNCSSPTASVQVKLNPLPVTKPIVGKDSALTGQTEIYTTTSDSGSTLNWVSFSGTIQGASTGKQVSVKWGAPGTGFVRVRETSMYGCKGTLMQQNVVIVKPPASGIDPDRDAQSYITTYPVPANERLIVQWVNTIPVSDCHIELYDMLGARVLSKQVRLSKGSQSVELDTREIAAGVYTLMLTAGENNWQIRTEISR